MTEVQLFLSSAPQTAEVIGYLEGYFVEDGLLTLSYRPFDSTENTTVVVPVQNVSQMRVYDTEDIEPENN